MKESLLKALKQLLVDSLGVSTSVQLEEAQDKTQNDPEIVYQCLDGLKKQDNPAFRVFTLEETSRFSPKCLNALLHLEGLGVLSKASREIIMDKVMNTQQTNISLDELKWIIMDVLSDDLGWDNQVFLDLLLNPSPEMCH